MWNSIDKTKLYLHIHSSTLKSNCRSFLKSRKTIDEQAKTAINFSMNMTIFSWLDSIAWTLEAWKKVSIRGECEVCSHSGTFQLWVSCSSVHSVDYRIACGNGETNGWNELRLKQRRRWAFGISASVRLSHTPYSWWLLHTIVVVCFTVAHRRIKCYGTRSRIRRHHNHLDLPLTTDVLIHSRNAWNYSHSSLCLPLCWWPPSVRSSHFCSWRRTSRMDSSSNIVISDVRNDSGLTNILRYESKIKHWLAFCLVMKLFANRKTIIKRSMIDLIE